jgi:hypothetical protein
MLKPDDVKSQLCPNDTEHPLQIMPGGTGLARHYRRGDKQYSPHAHQGLYLCKALSKIIPLRGNQHEEREDKLLRLQASSFKLRSLKISKYLKQNHQFSTA